MATESSRKMGGENPSLSANDLKLTALQESLSLRDLGRWPTSLPRLQTSLSPGFRRAGGISHASRVFSLTARRGALAWRNVS